MMASKVLQLIRGTSMAVSKRDGEKREFLSFPFYFNYLNALESAHIVNELQKMDAKIYQRSMQQ